MVDQVFTDISGVEILEGAVTRKMEEHLNGHYLGKRHFWSSYPLFTIVEQALFPKRNKFNAEIVDGTEYFGNFKGRNHEQKFQLNN
jgi:hypothetical protein